LRRGISFREHDLVLDPYPAGFDLIVCRNVLLYLTPEHGAAVVERLAASLAPGGWLLLGSADPHHHVVSLLDRVRTASGALYRRGDGRPALSSPSPSPSSRTRRGCSKARPPRPSAHNSLQAATVDRGTSTGLPSSAPASMPQDDEGEDPLRSCERALAEEPLEPRHHVRYATLLLEAGRAVSAVRAATAAVFLAPDLAPAHVALGRAHLALDETISAARAFRNARELLAGLPEDGAVAGSSVRAGRLRQMVDAGIRSAGSGKHR
jgi:chemotaxis protein methyltransferase CheR